MEHGACYVKQELVMSNRVRSSTTREKHSAVQNPEASSSETRPHAWEDNGSTASLIPSEQQKCRASL